MHNLPREILVRYLDIKNPIDAPHREALNSILLYAYKASNMEKQRQNWPTIQRVISGIETGNFDDLLSEDFIENSYEIVQKMRNKFPRIKNLEKEIITVNRQTTELALQTNPTVQNYRDLFFYEKAQTQHRSKCTSEVYMYTFKSLDKYKCVSSIEEYTYDYFVGYFEHYQDSWSDATRASRIRDIEAFLRWYNLKRFNNDEKLAKEHNPLKSFHRKVYAPPKPSLEHDDIQILINSIKHNKFMTPIHQLRNICIITILFGTGIRAKELGDLLIEDVNLDAETLLVRCGKGKKTRTIKLPSGIISFFRIYLKERLSLPSSSPYFFLSIKRDESGNYTPVTKNTLKTMWKYIKKNTSVKVNSHMFRRSWGVDLIKKGVPIVTIQKGYGHESIETTMLYISPTDSMLGDAARLSSANNLLLA